MNSAIHHSARPGDFKSASQNQMKAQINALCRQMGIDPKDLGPQAENVWSMLDDLAENDPEGYTTFLKKQKEDHENIQREKEDRKFAFSPKPGFVVKTRTTKSHVSGMQIKTARVQEEGKKVFVNFCHHEGVEPPTDQLRNAVMGPRASAEGLQVPMLMSEARDCLDNSGELCYAVDVIFNSWVIEQTKRSPPFKSQVIQLGLQWAYEEVGLVLSPQYKVIKAIYKGGKGEKGNTPIPFPIEKARSQSAPPDHRNANKEKDVSVGHSVKSVSVSSTQPPPPPQPDDAAPVNTLKTPQDLIKGLAQPIAEANDSIQFPNTSQQPADGKKKPLIEEVVPKDLKKETGRDEKLMAKKQQTKNPGKAVEKGFLNKTKNPKLYDEGGSYEGQEPGSYARFMDRCKVVDMNNMSKEEQQAMMKQHAGNPSASPSSTKPKAPKTDPKPRFESVKKGFLDGNSENALYPEGSSEGGKPVDSKVDPEFERFMQNCDPELARGYQVLDEDPDPMAEQLADLAKALAPFDDAASAKGKSDIILQDDNQNSSTMTEMESKSNVQNSSLQTEVPAELTNTTFTYKIEQSGEQPNGGKELVVNIDLDPIPDEQYSDIDLHATSAALQVSSPGMQTLNIPLPFHINADVVKASLKRKAKMLKVKLMAAD